MKGRGTTEGDSHARPEVELGSGLNGHRLLEENFHKKLVSLCLHGPGQKHITSRKRIKAARVGKM